MLYEGEKVYVLALGYGYAVVDTPNSIDGDIYHTLVKFDDDERERLLYVRKLPSDCPEED